MPGWGGPAGEHPGEGSAPGLRPGDELPSDFRQHLAPLLGAEVSPAEGRALTEGPHPWPLEFGEGLGGKRVAQGKPTTSSLCDT